jgi:hypothetical protein
VVTESRKKARACPCVGNTLSLIQPSTTSRASCSSFPLDCSLHNRAPHVENQHLKLGRGGRGLPIEDGQQQGVDGLSEQGGVRGGSGEPRQAVHHQQGREYGQSRWGEDADGNNIATSHTEPDRVRALGGTYP